MPSCIDAESATVASVLTEMVARVRAAGGEIHPNAVLRERGGQMTVLCTAPAHDRRPLFSIPKSLLVRVDGAVWSQRNDRLELVSPPPGLPADQAELLDLHVRLFNAAGKIPWVEASHPARSLARHPDLERDFHALFRPPAAPSAAGLATVGVPPAPAEGAQRTAVAGAVPPGAASAATLVSAPAAPPHASAAQVFLGSRVFGMPARLGGGRVLMTLADLLNHHRRGSQYRLDASGMKPRIARPSESSECFAVYRTGLSPLDATVAYGYCDIDSVSVHSAAVTINAGPIGRVTIEALPSRSRYRLNPPRVQRSGKGLALSHVEFDAERPDIARSAVTLPVKSAVLAAGLGESVAREVSSRVWLRAIEENVGARESLADRCSATAGEPGLAVLSQALRREAALLATMLPATGATTVSIP